MTKAATQTKDKDAAAKSRKPAGVSGTIKVRATAMGFYDDVRRHPGDVFVLYPRKGTFSQIVRDKDGEPKTLKTGTAIEHPVTEEIEDVELSAEDQFSKKWMERVEDETPEHRGSAQDRIRREHNQILQDRGLTTPETATLPAKEHEHPIGEDGPTGDQGVLGD